MKASVVRALAAGLAVGVTLTAVVGADDWAEQKLWTSVGSAGHVRLEDLDKVVWTGAQTTLAGVAPAEVNILYNIVAVDGLIPTSTAIGLRLNYLDQGPGQRVTARLFEYDLQTSTSTLLVAFDSDSVPPSPEYQLQDRPTCSVHTFDFSQKAYYVLVGLHRTSDMKRSPGIGAVQIYNGVCDVS